MHFFMLDACWFLFSAHAKNRRRPFGRAGPPQYGSLAQSRDGAVVQPADSRATSALVVRRV